MRADLIFTAEILAIECAPLRGPPRARRSLPSLDWIVRTRVIEVVAGAFDGDRFDFRIHSPARAGIVVGERRTIRASWTGDGYRVDEDRFIASE